MNDRNIISQTSFKYYYSNGSKKSVKSFNNNGKNGNYLLVEGWSDKIRQINKIQAAIGYEAAVQKVAELKKIA